MDKRALRARLRAARDAFVIAGPRPIVAPADFVARLRPGMTIASYAPIGSEAGPDQLVQAARRAGCRLALPYVVDRATPIRFVGWAPEAPLLAGPFGLAQPAADAEVVAPDVVLTPLLGFDAALNRLGQGAGHYDRAFATYPQAWRVGVAWSVQQVDALPADPWDMPLHAIVTEAGWLTR